MSARQKSSQTTTTQLSQRTATVLAATASLLEAVAANQMSIQHSLALWASEPGSFLMQPLGPQERTTGILIRLGWTTASHTSWQTCTCRISTLSFKTHRRIETMPFDVAPPLSYATTSGVELHPSGTASIGPLLRSKARNSTPPDTWATSWNTNVRVPN